MLSPLTSSGTPATTRRRAARLGIMAVAALMLWGCAADADDSQLGDYGDVTLAQTKSPVQLLRNEAAARVPIDVFAALSTEDHSVSCLPIEEDPEGRIRSWQSIAHLAVLDVAAPRIDSIVDTLAQGFVEQGWKLASRGGSSLVDARNLSKGEGFARIEVKASTTDPDAMYGAETKATDVTLEIVVAGPCVATDGVESSEVTSLDPSAE